jgi:AraC-like DNA-binding protein/ligand-binding sensor protein
MNSEVAIAQSRALVAQLRRSQIFRDYEKAFRETTGLPLALRAVEGFDLPHRHDPKENSFCALMAQSNHSCADCLRLQRRVEQEASQEAKTLICFAGFSDSAIPVRVGSQLVGFLQTGQVLMHPPRKSDFAKAARHLELEGTVFPEKELEQAYFRTRVVTPKQYESILRLLMIFSEHLSALSNQLIVRGATSEPPLMTKARALIAERYAEELSLTTVARSVNMSAFYFCKTFRKTTGVTFTEYLARIRVEKVKDLLLNPHKRVSEAAYEVGFQSLSQFNRVFRRIAGQSPSVYRAHLQTSAFASMEPVGHSS